VPPDTVQLVQQYLPEMQKRMPPHAMEQLGLVVQKFIQAAPEINLAKWGHAVDAVSHRAGFVVCGDLEVAARMVSAEPVTVGGPQVKDKIKELVLYSISEEFFAVRAQMGLRSPDDLKVRIADNSALASAGAFSFSGPLTHRQCSVRFGEERLGWLTFARDEADQLCWLRDANKKIATWCR
jgi:hypothetical protein